MAYYTDQTNGDIIINGWEKGIANSPHPGAQPLLGQAPVGGISDLRNINTVSVPGEAAVNFATSQISPPSTSGTVTSANAGTFYLTYTGATLLENLMTIVFSAQSGLGVSTNTAYWIFNLGGAGPNTFQITSDYAQTTVVHVTNGTGTFTNAVVGKDPINGGTGAPRFFTYDATDNCYFMLDGAGLLWTNQQVTVPNAYWTWTGPSGTTAGINQGCGLAYYQSTPNSLGVSNDFVFVFRNQTIDYYNVVARTWTFGWVPSTGAPGSAAPTLNASTTIHNAYVGTDNVVYYCDGSFIGSFFEKRNGPPQTIYFNPADTTTYTFASQALALPVLDRAQCIAELGINLMIGGRNNAIYPWNRTATSFTYPILCGENNIQNLVTVNTNMYIFIGNRGRIYITNGSQAQLYRKVPDHLSGTIEPYYKWGGAMFNKNQLYFSLSATTNAGTTPLPFYGGIWSIDLDSASMRLVNELSYGTYAGLATAMIPKFIDVTNLSNPAGSGYFSGWDNGAFGYGIDITTSAPYTAGQATVDSDLIPIGTTLKPTTNGRVEFKLSVPMVANESIQLLYRQKFSDSFAAITGATFSGAGVYSGSVTGVNFENSQWIQLRAVLTSTATNPSYVRLYELRLGN